MGNPVSLVLALALDQLAWSFLAASPAPSSSILPRAGIIS